MTTVKKIAKNNLFLLSGQVTSLVLGLFYFAYMAGYLGAKNLGILNTAISLTLIIGLLGDLGLSSLMTREISRNQSLAPKYLGNILLVKVLLAVLSFAVVVVVANILGYSEPAIQVIYIIMLSTIATNFTQVFTAIFQAFERFEFQSFGVILNSILMTVGIIFLVYHKLDLIYFSLLYFIVNSIILLYSFFICLRKLTFFDFHVDWVFLKQIILESLPFWLNSVFVLIYFKIDMVMLSIISGDTSVGLYSASYRLIDALSFIPVVLMSTMYPVFSKFYVSSKESLEFAFKKSFKFLTIIAIPIGIGTTILAERIILFIYRDVQYSPSAVALQILIWASVLSFMNYGPSTYFSSTNRQRALMIFTCIGAVLNIFLNFILIPRFSYNGAAIATVCSELAVGILMISNIHVQNFSGLLTDVILKSLVAGAFMGIFLLIFHSFTLILLILFAAIIYFIILYIINGFEKEEINLFNQVFGR